MEMVLRRMYWCKLHIVPNKFSSVMFKKKVSHQNPKICKKSIYIALIMIISLCIVFMCKYNRHIRLDVQKNITLDENANDVRWKNGCR